MEGNFYQRTKMLLGEAGLAKVKSATVAVCGIGGVGAAAVEALARAGVGHLRLLDFDEIVASNLNRQLHTTVLNIGMPKAEAMAERIGLINPNAKVEVIYQRITGENVHELLQGVDYVIDAIDDVPGKVAILVYTKNAGIPVISSMGTGNKLHPEMLELADLSKTEVCPLARKMRYELKKQGITKGIWVVYSKEQPITPSFQVEDGLRHPPGSISFVPPVAGMIIAGKVIRDLAGLD